MSLTVNEINEILNDSDLWSELPRKNPKKRFRVRLTLTTFYRLRKKTHLCLSILKVYSFCCHVLSEPRQIQNVKKRERHWGRNLKVTCSILYMVYICERLIGNQPERTTKFPSGRFPGNIGGKKRNESSTARSSKNSSVGTVMQNKPTAYIYFLAVTEGDCQSSRLGATPPSLYCDLFYVLIPQWWNGKKTFNDL